MSIEPLLLLGGGLGAGIFGSLLGLGGGIVLVPLLTLGFGLPLPSAIGTSLVAVVATSAGAAAHNLRSGVADLRLALLLQVGAIVGATAGGLAAGLIADRVLAGLFAGLMIYTAASLLRTTWMRTADPPERQPQSSGMADHAADAYWQGHLPVVAGGSLGAGVVSALLGVGGGIVTVPLLRLALRVPIHVAAATSNVVLGSTAAAGAWAFLVRGDVQAATAGPVVLGAALGAAAGARLAPHVRARWLIALFLVVATWVVFEMAATALGISR